MHHPKIDRVACHRQSSVNIDRTIGHNRSTTRSLELLGEKTLFLCEDLTTTRSQSQDLFMSIPNPDFILWKLKRSDSIIPRLQMMKYFDHEIIDQLVYGVSSFVTQEHQNIVCRAQEIQADSQQEGLDKDWLMDSLIDEHYFLDEAKKLSHELAIIALYKKIEITTNRVVSIAYPDISSKSLYRIDQLKKELTKKGIQIDSLPHYAAMDEVRCLNNDIKHNGVVSDKLALYPCWIKGSSLQDLEVAYTRLAPLCSLYMIELVDVLIEERLKLISHQINQNKSK